MQKRSVKLSYSLSLDELIKAKQDFVYEIYKDRLGRLPQTDDKFFNTLSQDNSFIEDMYFDGEKYGTLATSVIVDTPGWTELVFTPQ